jgi:hypothetical protein
MKIEAIENKDQKIIPTQTYNREQIDDANTSNRK